MDPLDRIKFIITAWENWIKRYKTFKYHGVTMRCKDSCFYVPVFESPVISPTPPIYFEYKYTGDESFGWASVFFSFYNYALLASVSDFVRFSSFGTRLKKDCVTMRVTNPKCDGSMLMNWSFIDYVCGVEKPDIPIQNYCTFTFDFTSPLSHFSNYYGKYGWYKKPPAIDYWAWLHQPSDWSYSYILNWRYYPISGVYDLWDNESQKILKTTTTTFNLINRASWRLVMRDYPGTCFRYLGYDITDISFYSNVWFPIS